MEKRNILNQNRRDIDFNKSINSGFTGKIKCLI